VTARLDDVLQLLRMQRARGPLPSAAHEVSAFIAALQRKLPIVAVEVPNAAVSPLRAAGVVVDERDGRHLARLPADGDAVDRVFALLGLTPPASADALLRALEQPDATPAPPQLSFPLRIQPAKASALGWSSELVSLTVLIGNVTVRAEDSALVSAEGRPAVAVCAEYERPLVSLDPPSVADWALDGARAHGVPTLRLSAGLFRSPVRLETTNRSARAIPRRPEAVVRAGRFLEELSAAWRQRIAPAVEVAWPVYRHAGDGPPLDAVVGRPLPELELC
jgi:hypothetical protein